MEKLTSLVIGPGERVVINSTTQNNVFSLIGFEDASVATLFEHSVSFSVPVDI